MPEFDDPSGPQPELEPQKHIEREPARAPTHIPQIERIESSGEPSNRIVPPAFKGNFFGRTARVVVALLLLIPGLFMIAGHDVKQTVYPPPAAQVETVPDEIVVDLKDNITDEEIARISQTFGIELRYNSIHSRDWKIMVAKVPPAKREQILAGLKQLPSVEIAEPQVVDRHNANWVPNDPEYGRQWHLKMIGLEEAWAVTRGKGAVVAVVDSGFGAVVKSQYVPLQDFGATSFAKGYDFVYDDDIPEDGHGHGSHVAGTIAESTNNGHLGAGVAPEATIIPVRVMGPNGTGDGSDTAEGIKFAADQGANVINLSLGGAYTQLKEKACQYAYQKGAMLICAAGNDNKQGFDYPGNFKECFVVGAVGPQGSRAPYSNWGDKMDIAAPGGDQSQGMQAGVWQNTMQRKRPVQRIQLAPNPLIDSFYSFQGTSMAAPHAAGVAALLVSVGVKDPAEIRSILRKTAKAAGDPKQYGAGILDAARAVESMGKSKQNSKGSLWLLGAIALVVLVSISGSKNKKKAVRLKAKPVPDSLKGPLIAFGIGWFAPLAFEKVFGFGSYWNFAGHSVILPVIWLLTRDMKRPMLLQAAAFMAGVMLHLLLDLRSGATPFQVHPQSRITFWLYANLAVGAYFLYAAFHPTVARNAQAPVAQPSTDQATAWSRF